MNASVNETDTAKGYARYVLEDMRLLMLRLLSELPAYTANSSTLHSALQSWGHHVARGDVVRQLHWLAERALVELETITEDVLLVRLLDRGLDVAQGIIRHPGIKPVRPRAV